MAKHHKLAKVSDKSLNRTIKTLRTVRFLGYLTDLRALTRVANSGLQRLKLQLVNSSDV